MIDNKITTFKWKNPEELPKLYNGMKNIFIAKNTSYENFELIFLGDTVSKIINPIELNKKMTNRLLAYFLFQIENLQYIDRCNWQNIADKGKIFMNYSGKIINNKDLSVAKAERNYRTEKQKPRGYKEIDNLLKEIKNISNISSY